MKSADAMRQVIVVDVETSALGNNGVILEVAALNLDTGEEMHFVPYVPMSALATADPAALRINRYFERDVRAEMLREEDTAYAYHGLRQWLKGNTLAGSNPTFDAEKLAAAGYSDPIRSQGWSAPFIQRRFGQPHHHRLLDLSAYAAGVLGLPPSELPGLHRVCKLLDVTNEDEHSALGDVRATAECFHALINIAGDFR